MAAFRTPKPRILALGSSAMLIVIVVGWFVAPLFNVSGGWLWLVRGLIWALGFFVIYLVLRLFQRGDEGGSSDPDAIDELLTEARKHLASAGVAGRGALSKLPIVFIFGPRGSTKTTLVVQSGLGAEHLAGNARRGEGLVPTEALNLWYHDDQVLLEAAGQIATEPARFGKLIRRTLPSRWVPALLGKPQAPRVAVVCVSCEDLVGGMGSDGAMAVARNFQTRLAELSRAIGVRLPVYVVFTKVDRVPYFTEYAQGLTDAEVREVLGVTLNAVEDPGATSYAQLESRRLGAAFDELFRSLAGRRLSVLSRGAVDVSDRAYEFPREFRKLSAPAIQFLVELTRPSQLRVSPFLRGFYFTGVRPVVVSEEEAGPMLAPEATGQPAPPGATKVFNLRDLQAPGPQVAEPQEGHERRVPQWVFMERILSRAVLRDRLTLGMTAAGTGLRVRRRLAMAGLLGLTIVLGMSTLVAFWNDRGLVNEVEASIRGVQPIRSAEPDLASLEDLEALDRLRGVTETLSAFENGGGPLRRWLRMYGGARLYTLAKEAYFDRFRTLLLDRAYRSIVRTLDGAPDDPTLEDYDRVYRALKAHVEMTAVPDSARADFFGPVLTSHWGFTPDSAQMALATSQFEFYGHELPFGIPNPDPSDDRRININILRRWLASNTTEESFYRSVLGQWNRLPPVRFNQQYEGSDRYVQNTLVVPGAFTKAGWEAVHTSLDDIGEEFNLDSWVVGDSFFDSLIASGFDPDEMGAKLTETYEDDYVDMWVDFLNNTSVNFPSLQSEGWLRELSNSRSFLLQLFTVVAENTRVSTAVSNVFTPVHILTAPDSMEGRVLFSDPTGRRYLDNLSAMARAMGAFADEPGNQELVAAARNVARDGESFVDNIARDFPNDPPAAREVSVAVSSLLRDPFRFASQSTAEGSRVAGNRIVRQFCSQNAILLNQYPFRENGTDATLEDVTALFGPEQGTLETFFTELETQYSSPGRSYLAFRRKSREITGTLFEDGAAQPEMSLRFRVQDFEGISGVSLNVDGQGYEFSATQATGRTVQWDLERAVGVTLAVRVAERGDSLTFPGRWGIFRLFQRGRWVDAGANVYQVTWDFPTTGATVVAEVRLLGDPILNGSYFNDFRCPSQVTG